MISRRHLKSLRKGDITQILLPDGYMLKLDDYKKIFISRGGKKKYYMSDKLLNSMCSNKPSNNMLLLNHVLTSLEDMMKRLKKETITRTRIENLIGEIRHGYE